MSALQGFMATLLQQQNIAAQQEVVSDNAKAHGNAPAHLRTDNQPSVCSCCGPRTSCTTCPSQQRQQQRQGRRRNNRWCSHTNKVQALASPIRKLSTDIEGLLQRSKETCGGSSMYLMRQPRRRSSLIVPDDRSSSFFGRMSP